MSESEYRSAVEHWREDMDRQMRSTGPGGWLAITGMYPLRQGLNTIGSAPDSDVILPPGSAPDRVGVVDFQDEHGTLQVMTDEVVTVDDVPTRSAILRNHYEAGGMSVIRVRDVRFGIMQWASDPYNIRVWDANAPKRLNFGGRVWYPIQPEYQMTGIFNPFPDAQKLTVDHTGGKTQVLKGIGTVDFDLRGQHFTFDAAASELGSDYVWLLMRDGTNGKTTYGAGRFMMAARGPNNQVDVDFNKFYLPPCAFCEYTTCPMPPRRNVLPFPIEAGEHFPE